MKKTFTHLPMRAGYGPRWELRKLTRTEFCLLWSLCTNNQMDSEAYKVIARSNASVFIQGHNAESGWFLLEMWGEMPTCESIIVWLESKLANKDLLEDYETMLREGWFDNFYPDTAAPSNTNLPSLYDLVGEDLMGKDGMALGDLSDMPTSDEP